METLKKQNNKPEKGNDTPEIQKLYMLISGARKKLQEIVGCLKWN